MKELAFNSLAEKGAYAIVKKLQENGYKAVYAGGCVRDALLGRHTDTYDFDIATTATPDEIIKLYKKAKTVGKAFGVVKVKVDDIEYEVATFRKDHSYKDGRRPVSVVFSDEKEDALRRDFTINALFYDPIKKELIDYVNGQDDLKKGIIRTVGEPALRFQEDYLRMLRAIRFASTLGFKIEKQTFEAIKQHANLITNISPERIQQELLRILVESEKRGAALQLLDESNLLQHILREVADLKNVQQPQQFHPEGDVWEHTIKMLDLIETNNHSEDFIKKLSLAVLFHDIGKPKTFSNDGNRIRFNSHNRVGAELTENIMRRLRMPVSLIKFVKYCVDNHMKFMEVKKMRRSTLCKMVAQPTFEVELELHRLDCLASHGDISNYEFLKDFVKQLSKDQPAPKPLLSGNDIMKILGIPEGPEVGKWKKMVYDAQLENQFNSKKEAINWLKEKAKCTIAFKGS